MAGATASAVLFGARPSARAREGQMPGAMAARASYVPGPYPRPRRSPAQSTAYRGSLVHLSPRYSLVCAEHRATDALTAVLLALVIMRCRDSAASAQGPLVRCCRLKSTAKVRLGLTWQGGSR